MVVRNVQEIVALLRGNIATERKVTLQAQNPTSHVEHACQTESQHHVVALFFFPPSINAFVNAQVSYSWYLSLRAVVDLF